jgi:hypothetical protein
MVDSGPYEQKPVPGITRKLVSLWLYWTPNEPERDEPPIPIPRKRQKASKTAPIKARPRSSQRSRTSLPLPSPPRQSGATNLVLSSPPRPPPQRGVAPQSLVELLPLATLTLERAPGRVKTRVKVSARAPATPRAVRTCRISGRCLTRLRSLQNSCQRFRVFR